MSSPRVRGVVAFAAVAVLLLGATRDATAQGRFAEAAARSAFADRLTNALDDLAHASSALRATPFTPQDVVADVGRDPAALWRFVRDHTRLVAYRGSLRGAHGVLADGRGNALDRATTLAELVRITGVEVVLVRGRLPIDVAREIVQASRGTPATAATAVDVDPDTARPDEEARLVVGTTLPLLLSACDGVEPGGDAADESLTEHWWVRARLPTGWTDLDVAATTFGVALTTPDREVAATPTGFALTDADVHRVTIDVVLERRSVDGATEHSVLRHVCRTIDAIGAPFVLSFHAPSWPSGREFERTNAGVAEFTKTLLAQREWMPVLQIGGTRVARASFDASGTVDPNPALDGRAKVGRGVASGFRGLGGLGGGDDGPTPQLTALWIEFRVDAPGLAAVVARHEVFDLVGPATRASAAAFDLTLDDAQRIERAVALLPETEILVLACGIDGALAARGDVESLLSLQRATAALRHAESERSFAEAANAIATAGLQVSVPLRFAVLRDALATAMDGTFVDRPNVVCHRRRTRFGADGMPHTASIVDLVVHAVATDAGDPTAARRARLRQSIVDTVVEQVAVAGAAFDGATTPSVFERALGIGVPIVVLRSLGDVATQTADWSSDAIARVGLDLANGHVVVAPRQPIAIDGRPRVGWWRVDARSGNAVGVMDTGFRQGNAEYDETTAITTDVQRARRFLDWFQRTGSRQIHRDLYRDPGRYGIQELRQIEHLQGLVRSLLAEAQYFGVGI